MTRNIIYLCKYQINNAEYSYFGGSIPLKARVSLRPPSYGNR